MKLFKILLFVLLALVLLYLITALIAPSSFKFEGKASIGAAKNIVFAEMKDLNNWPKWSPWHEEGYGIKDTYTGQTGMPNQSLNWMSNYHSSGSITYTKLIGDSDIAYTLKVQPTTNINCQGHFILKMTSFIMTDVIWLVEGKISFLKRPIHMFNDKDQWVNPYIERGLAKLDSICRIQTTQNFDKLSPSLGTQVQVKTK